MKINFIVQYFILELQSDVEINGSIHIKEISKKQYTIPVPIDIENVHEMTHDSW